MKMSSVRTEYPQHDDEPCQVAIFVSGKSSEAVWTRLKELMASRGYKPVQGIFLHTDSTIEVIRPAWRSES